MGLFRCGRRKRASPEYALDAVGSRCRVRMRVCMVEIDAGEDSVRVGTGGQGHIGAGICRAGHGGAQT